MIILNNISFAFKKNRWIYKKFSVKFEDSKCFAVIGHNGVGKTTLFRLMLGFLKPADGEIVYETKVAISKKNISYVPDFNGFFSGLTVYENIKFRQLFCSKDKDDVRLGEILHIFGLEEYKNEIVRDLSSGLKKRVALAAAIISNPQYLIMDEPTNGLDPKTREVIISVLEHLKSIGTTIIFSCHDLNFVYRLADEFLVLNKGVLTQKGMCSDYSEKDFIEEYFKSTEG